MATTGDASGRLAVNHNCGPILRQTRSTKGKADQAFSRQIFGCARKKGLAYEFGFLELDGPADIGFIRVGEGVGVDTDNHVALFESEQPLGLDAERPDVVLSSRLLTPGRTDLDLRDQAAVNQWFADQRPQVVFVAAAKSGRGSMSRWKVLVDELVVVSMSRGCAPKVATY